MLALVLDFGKQTPPAPPPPCQRAARLAHILTLSDVVSGPPSISIEAGGRLTGVVDTVVFLSSRISAPLFHTRTATLDTPDRTLSASEIPAALLREA